MLRLILCVVCLGLVGCFHGNYNVTTDPVTGKTVMNARIGAASRGIVTINLHAQMNGNKPMIFVYAVNTGLTWVNAVQLRLSYDLLSLKCTPDGTHAAGAANMLKSVCRLTLKQARLIVKTDTIFWRVGPVKGTSSAFELANAKKVFGHLLPTH